MKRIDVLILILVLTTLLVGCNSESAPQEYELSGREDWSDKPDEYKTAYLSGMEEAISEVENGRYILYAFGLPSDYDFDNQIDEETGLKYEYVAGCDATDAVLGRVDGHNDYVRLNYINTP